MMGRKERIFAPLSNVSLEELVPHDHFYRHLEHILDLSCVREFVQETYASGGRPSIGSVKPRFAVEAHLTNLFSTEAEEGAEAEETAQEVS